MRAIKIDPDLKTVEEIDIKGDLDSMEEVLKDGPCMVRISASDILWVGDNGLLTGGNPVFMFGSYVNPLAGPGLILGIEPEGENVGASILLENVKGLVHWTDKETTGELTPSRDFIRDGVPVHRVGDGILRDRKPA